jgi:hypothetical protein
MKSIWKYELPVEDIVKVEMQADAEILCVQSQQGTPCIWAVVDPKTTKCTRTFRIIGTGHPVSDDLSKMKYIGTFQMRDGFLIFHLFEIFGVFDA